QHPHAELLALLWTEHLHGERFVLLDHGPRLGRELFRGHYIWRLVDVVACRFDRARHRRRARERRVDVALVRLAAAEEQRSLDDGGPPVVLGAVAIEAI